MFSLEFSQIIVIIFTMIFLFSLAITTGMKATSFEKITTSNADLIDKDTTINKNATSDLTKINSILIPELSSNRAICAFSVLLIMAWITLFISIKFFYSRFGLM